MTLALWSKRAGQIFGHTNDDVRSAVLPDWHQAAKGLGSSEVGVRKEGPGRKALECPITFRADESGVLPHAGFLPQVQSGGNNGAKRDPARETYRSNATKST